MHGENQKNLAMKVMWGIFKVIGLNFFQRINALLYTSKIFKSELENIKIYDGIEELFEFLESKRYPFIIATTSSQSEVDDRLSKFPRFFEKLKGKIISRSDVENLKPDPESLLKASEMMGLHPKRVVMVGDMHSDILMGKNTDSVTIAVLTGIFKKEDFEKYHPDLILYSAAQIPDNISKIRQLINSK
ncbi:MAG: HAD-IA family hydrolase [Candidatus Lokiarchaeota archaeon]